MGDDFKYDLKYFVNILIFIILEVEI